MFFTRIPCPGFTDHSDEYLSNSSRYFSIVGIIVGGVSASVYYYSLFVFDPAISILFGMTTTLLLTGAFHEDGLSDFCDGFGGGWSKDDIIRIMKDSRIGTYGTIGIVMSTGIKFAAINSIGYQFGATKTAIAIISAHALSRFATSTLLLTLPYAKDEESKAKPAASGMNLISFVVCGVFGTVPLLLFSDYRVFVALAPVFAARFYLSRKFWKKIGGQTGDCAGATQQICEAIFYLSLLVIWKFI
ncbi:MAG: adenosylcobinamide-GDP ribazoletransferase [Planctomycetes bacterium]|nr:adenosylcobinamide-GDP ribazoletransferase [Planctomycetota bacterium]